MRFCQKAVAIDLKTTRKQFIYIIILLIPLTIILSSFYFRPTGWDNDKKIAILHENLQNIKPEEAFEDVISKPITRKVYITFCLIS